MKTYKDELIKSMNYLAEKPNTIFVGQQTAYPGNTMSTTILDVPMEKMIETGDVRSLATDKIYGNRVFKDDLMESIASGTYADLGLSEEQIKNMDPTPNDKITYEDAAQITSSIMKDEDQLKNYLAEYYTNILEQNYYKNLHPDVRLAMDEKNKKPKLSTDGGIKVNGGTIINGVFVPGKPS